MQAAAQRNDSDSPLGTPGCPACAFYKLNLCAEVRQKFSLATSPLPSASPLTSSVHTIPPRRTIYHPKEWSEFVPVICTGWVLSSVALPDGRRQVLSIMLSGDITYSGGLFEPASGYTAEAITETTYRKFKRVELKALLFEYRDLFEMFTKIWDEEKVLSDQLALDLGRRTSTERIARLIVNLADRLAKRGMMNDHTMPFPFRHRHIADATGLTPVHVSRVLSEFQRHGLIEINDRSLTITNAAELRQTAGS